MILIYWLVYFSWTWRSSVLVIVDLSTLELSKVKSSADSFLWKLLICMSFAMVYLNHHNETHDASIQEHVCPSLDQIPNFRFCSVSSVKVAGYCYCHITSCIFVDFRQLITFFVAFNLYSHFFIAVKLWLAKGLSSNRQNRGFGSRKRFILTKSSKFWNLVHNKFLFAMKLWSEALRLWKYFWVFSNGSCDAFVIRIWRFLGSSL